MIIISLRKVKIFQNYYLFLM